MSSTLLYALRSPTTTLSAKLSLASSSLSLSSSGAPLVASQVRDWLLDTLLKSRKDDSSSTILSRPCWALLDHSLLTATGLGPTPPLPIFIAFLQRYSDQDESDADLVGSVGRVFARLAGGAMKKATVDAVLEGYAELVKASVKVVLRDNDDRRPWEDLADHWLKAFRTVADSGKAGKKIPLHTLANLPSIVALLPILSPDEPFLSALLQTLQFTLFNLENLRRGLARESYNAASSSADDAESASSELLNALKALLPTQSTLVQQALPTLFALYRTSLSTHATALFPLPAKTSFPTASAFRSATELHAFSKRRALAASWIRGVASLLEWTSPPSLDSSAESRIVCLSATLEEVERGDLYRESNGDGDGWDGVLEALVQGAQAFLPRPAVHSALLSLLSVVGRLSFSALTPALLPTLSTLASHPPTSPSSSSSLAFLSVLLTHHSRSHSLPISLLQLSTALASPSAKPSNLLTQHAFSASLHSALAALVAPSVRSAFSELVQALSPSSSSNEIPTPDTEGPSKKRRKVASVDSTLATTSGTEARLRLLALFVRAVPSPVPEDLFVGFKNEQVEPAVKELAKGREVGLGCEMLGVRYAMVERLRKDGSEELKSWELGRKRTDAIVELVGREQKGEVVLELARTLLQSLSASTPEADAHAIIAAILARLSTSSTTPWTGHAHGMTLDELPSALWELVTRRWLQTLEASASTEQLAQLAAIVVQCLSNPENPQEISLHATTARLLRRADFYELRRLQAQIHPSLLTLLSLPHLTSPTDVLSSLSLKKLPKALRALEASRVVEAVATFERVAKLVPMEYLGKGLRNDLIERALALDVWITSGQAGENVGRVEVLRSFVVGAAAEGSPLAEGPAILAHLVNGTTTVDPATTKVTIDLYRHFVQSSVIVYTGDKLTAPLEAYLAAFESPLAALAKRAKKAPGPVAPDELAFFALCDVLSSSLGDFASVPEALRSTIETIVKAASKPLGKALVATTAAIVASPEAVWDCADLLDGCRRFWQLKDWISGTAEHDQVEPFAAFAQAALGVLVDHAAHPERLEVQPNSLRTCLAMLDLLGFRIARLRALSDPKKHATGPFETFLACHLAFRQGLRAVPGASAALLSNLKRATSTSTLREYAAALAGISAFIGETVASETAANQIASLEPALEVALVLLRDGPAGSSRLSTECLSDVLRHLSLLLTKLSPLVGEPVQGAALAEALLVVSTFIEGVCGERPMLLSRQNVSSVLALVARMLQPSGPLPALPASSTPTPASLTSSLWLSLVTTVDHLVRHRKDHISPLFPHLVATLAPMLLALRRAGFGTTGSSSSVALEDADVSVAVGKRAEREARATFPSWVWEGGAQGVGRAEAKAVGRLLASLSAKTTSSASLKRKHGATVDNAAATTTTSLAAPLSKHAPFILLPYLRACVNVAAPIPSALRSELQGGWFEVMDAMGKWEREALMKGFLGEEEEAEKGVLRGMWRTWEKERYRG